MATIKRPHIEVDQALRENGDVLEAGINALGQFFFSGNGAPSFTPTGRAIYIRLDGGAATTLYCWSGAAWNAFA